MSPRVKGVLGSRLHCRQAPGCQWEDGGRHGLRGAGEGGAQPHRGHPGRIPAQGWGSRTWGSCPRAGTGGPSKSCVFRTRGPEAQASVSPGNSAEPSGAGLSASSRPWHLHALRQCLCGCHPEGEMQSPQKLGVAAGGWGCSEPWTMWLCAGQAASLAMAVRAECASLYHMAFDAGCGLLRFGPLSGPGLCLLPSSLPFVVSPGCVPSVPSLPFWPGH